MVLRVDVPPDLLGGEVAGNEVPAAMAASGE